MENNQMPLMPEIYKGKLKAPDYSQQHESVTRQYDRIMKRNRASLPFRIFVCIALLASVLAIFIPILQSLVVTIVQFEIL